MGYDIYITRKDSPFGGDGQEISLQEWQAHVAGDPSLSTDPDNPPPENYLLKTPSGVQPLWWDKEGQVYTQNPEPHFIAEMARIAEALEAKVMGEGEELYGRDGNIL
jgi:hypothetical protein